MGEDSRKREPILPPNLPLILPPNRILTPSNSSHPPLATCIPQIGDPLSHPQGINFVELWQVEINELAKFGFTPQNQILTIDPIIQDVAKSRVK